jgi:hypothetical protein
MFYVYELLDPRDGKVFYVGTSKKCTRIREIEAAGLYIEKRKVKSFADAVDALVHEAELIAFHGLDNLTNVMPGGSGAVKFARVDDAEFVSGFAKLMRRTGGRALATVWVMGAIPVDMKPVFDRLEKHLGRVIKRRGEEWVNKIAGKQDVRFV